MKLLFAVIVALSVYSIESSPIERPESESTLSKEELILKLAELLLNSKTVQDFLKKEGKPLLAKGLEKLDVVLHELDTKVHKANPKTKIGQLALKGLEKLIEKAEVEVEAEVKKIEDEIHKKPPTSFAALSKEELLLKLAEMLINSKQFQELLQKVGKPLLAKGLEKIDVLLHELDDKVHKADPKTKIGKLALEGLEKLIEKTEVELEAEIKKIEDEIHKPPTSFADVDKGVLLAQLADLIDLATSAVEVLTKNEKRPDLATGISAILTKLKTLKSQVSSAPVSQLATLQQQELKLEQELVTEFVRVQAELDKNTTMNSFAGLSKEELLLKLAEMLINSKQVQELLQKVGKPLLAKGLEKIDVLLHELDDKVHKADPKTKIGKLALEGLEKLIEKTEVDLEVEIKKIEDEIHKPPTSLGGIDIEGIIKTAEMLISKAKVLVEELKQQGRGVEAKGLALLEDAAIDAVQKVKEYKPITELDKLIQKGLVNTLKYAENKLDAFIQNLEK